jgi:hypothetical protein
VVISEYEVDVESWWYGVVMVDGDRRRREVGGVAKSIPEGRFGRGKDQGPFIARWQRRVATESESSQVSRNVPGYQGTGPEVL